MSGFVGRDRPRNVLRSAADGVVVDALISEESADENEEVEALSLLEIVFLVRGAPYRWVSLLLRGGITGMILRYFFFVFATVQ